MIKILRVIPAQAGIQSLRSAFLDPSLRWDDDEVGMNKCLESFVP